MHLLTGTSLFWFLAIGLLIGAAIGRIIGKEGVSFYANVIWGGIGAIITGSIAVILQIGDGILFSLLGTLAFLFLVNIFHQHHQEDLSQDLNTSIKLRKR